MSRRAPAVVIVAVLIAGAGAWYLTAQDALPDAPPFEAQACAFPGDWLELTRRGYYEPRSGQISLLPRYPSYMASGGGGWSHSGPWPYLQEVPLVFYGPGIIPEVGDVAGETTLADIAPTTAALIGADLGEVDGRVLDEVIAADGEPRLVVTIVWDGGGWNTLQQWPDEWPHLAAMMAGGVSYTDAIVGSSPSVTPAVHASIGTGVFPDRHGVTGVPVRDEAGVVVDAFLNGESSRFLQVPTLAELWDEANDNDIRVGLVGYEPWHLGLIGKGAERPGGDKDDAVWLHHDTNHWITNPNHYRMPPALPATEGLEDDIRELDAADGVIDGAWGEHAILDQRDRIEEVPAFVHYHGRALRNLISQEGYGSDPRADLLYTNFKQIDRVGHYFNMASDEVRQNLVASDEELGRLLEFLDDEVGEGRWVVALTADHGQQPDAEALGAWGINPRAVEAAITERFGPVVRAVWPTEVFLHTDVMEEQGVTIEEVARFLAGHRLKDNTEDEMVLKEGAGSVAPEDPLYEMVIPAALLPEITC